MAKSPARRSPKRGSTDERSTRERLIDTVVELMETRNPDDVRIEEVLATSGISSGSLYHHFANFPDLVDQAVVARYSADIDVGMAILTQAVVDATDVESLSRGLREATARAMSSSRSAIRFNRSQVMARAAANQRFREALLPHQQRLNDAFAGLFRQLQAKGLVDPAVDPVTASFLVQAYTMGFVVNDVSGNPSSDEAVVDMIMRMLDRTFFVHPQGD